MKVVCILNEIDDGLAGKVGLPEGEPRLYRSISPGKEYLVLGLVYSPASSSYAGYPVVEIKNDSGGLSTVPIFMFEITESSPSKSWVISIENRVLKMLPKSFYGDFYHDDLSEGVPETVDDFNIIVKRIESES